MKRLLFIVGLLGLLGVASACGGGGQKEVTLPGDGGNVKITTGGELPKEFPDDFPIFKGANLTGTVAGEQEGKTGYVATWETDASTQEVTDFYKGALDKDPWKTASVFTSSNGALISFSRADNENFGGAVTISGDGKTQVAVFLGEGAGQAPSAEATTEEQPTPEKKATPEGGQTPTQAELPPEVALPDDYPSDVAPIPSGARIIGADSPTTERSIPFTVTYLTKEDLDSIADFYGSKVPGNGWSETSHQPSSGEIFLEYENQAEGGDLILAISKSDTWEGYTQVFLLLTVGQ